mmetsp:Transcript_31815/g.66678  ORF Transcript_31815/g.66678 Transcript_31815/m.66678 type:complete len:126 (-) Transcript_31815:2338-2715(-)
MFNYLSEGIENRSGSHSDEDIRKLIIEIATNDGFLNIGCSLSIFIMKSNAIENMWQDQNDSKKQHDGKVTIHLKENRNMLARRIKRETHGVCIRMKTFLRCVLTKPATSPPFKVLIQAIPGTVAI